MVIMSASNILIPLLYRQSEQMMNKNFHVLYTDDTLRTVMEYYLKYKVTPCLSSLWKEKLIGVFPKNGCTKLY
jgi:hypothetical protein